MTRTFNHIPYAMAEPLLTYDVRNYATSWLKVMLRKGTGSISDNGLSPHSIFTDRRMPVSLFVKPPAHFRHHVPRDQALWLLYRGYRSHELKRGNRAWS